MSSSIGDNKACTMTTTASSSVVSNQMDLVAAAPSSSSDKKSSGGGGKDTTAHQKDNDDDDDDDDDDPVPPPGEAELLVSEFPPPPYYYRWAASRTTQSNDGRITFGLQPPPIPEEALARGTRRAAAAAARARQEMERLRATAAATATAASASASVGGSGSGGGGGGGDSSSSSGIGGGSEGNHDRTTDDKTNAILGGVVSTTTEEEEDPGDVVAVFGEIVEDPLLVKPLDICEDPKVVRDEVMRLNREVVQGYITLVQDLVQRPLENKRRRDDLSDKIFLMLQECNKFREHQAREILIELLEKQLKERTSVLQNLRQQIDTADDILSTMTDQHHITHNEIITGGGDKDVAMPS